MKKNIINIFKIFISILIIILGISTFSNVYGGENFNPSQFNGKEVETDVNGLVDDAAGTVVAVLRVASVTIAIIVLLVIAMKYMISSAGDRADIKKHAVAYVIGTFILFSATQIIALLIEIANNFSEN